MMKNRYRTDSPFRAGIRIAADFRDKHRAERPAGIFPISPTTRMRWCGRPEKPTALMMRSGKFSPCRRTSRDGLPGHMMVDGAPRNRSIASCRKRRARLGVVGDIRAIAANLSDRPDLMDCMRHDGRYAGGLARATAPPRCRRSKPPSPRRARPSCWWTCANCCARTACWNGWRNAD